MAIARGTRVKVKGGMGSILVLAEEQTDNYDLRDWKVIVIDGEQFKANTWYQLTDGKIEEVDDGE